MTVAKLHDEPSTGDREQRHRRAKRAAVMTALSCFLVSANSAFANGGGGLPPVVVHPVHNFAPVTHTLPNTNPTHGFTSNSGDSKSPIGSSGSNYSNNSNNPNNSNNSTNFNNSTNSSTSGNPPAANSSHLSGAIANSHARGHLGAIRTTNVNLINNYAPSTISSIHPQMISSLPNGGYQLDLSSTTQNIVLGSSLFAQAQSATIAVGNSNVTYTVGQKVTAAEYVAIQQQLNHGQTLVLTNQGAADGGKFSLNSVINSSVSELVVPTGVTGVDYLSRNNALSLSGDLFNYGSIYGVAANNKSIGATNASISALDITNGKGATISTVLPNSMLSGTTNPATIANLSLNATNTIMNLGDISSSGAVTLATAHGAIANNAGATITANDSVNLNAGSGELANAGTITTHNANININSGAGTDLNVNAQGGTFQASNNINLRTPSYTGSNNGNLNGGNYLSQNLNITSGGGAITGSVGRVTGQLNTSGNAEHFVANTPSLILGNNALQADPLFANNGSIVINGGVTTGLPNENITIVASGNITVGTSSDAFISTQNSITPGTNGSVILIAGAQVTPSGTSTPTLPTGSSSTSASVSFAAGAGGNIDLFTNNTHSGKAGEGALIDTSSPGAGSAQINGGSVILAALANGASGGQVTLSAGGANNGASIDTSSTNGNGGSVTIIAGQSAGTVVRANGPIVTGGSSGTGNGGGISIFAQQPTSSIPLSIDSHGNVTGSIQPTGTVNNATVSLQGAFTGTTSAGLGTSGNAGSINISAGSVTSGANLDTSAGTGNGGNINIVASSNVQLTGLSTIANGAGTAGSIAIASSGSVATTSISTASTNGSGGNVNISGASFSNTNSLLTNSHVNGGNVQVQASGDVTTGVITTSGTTSGTGGNIILSGSTITTSALTTNGVLNGGNIILNATGAIDSGNITTGIIITSSTTGGGGVVTALAGNTLSAAKINIPAINSSGVLFGGQVEIVNNAGTSAGAVNISLNTGGINSTASNGSAGAISLVSLSGEIQAVNLITSAVSTGKAAVSGGGIFVSSGSTGATAIDITGAINTSAPTSGFGSSAGNIILLTSQTTTSIVNPSNITVVSAPVVTADKPGTVLKYGLAGASATIPAQVNISEATTGVNAINIRPGGYQNGQGAVNLNINNPDEQMVAPINVGNTGSSIILSGLTTNGNVSVVTSGNLSTIAAIATPLASTGNVTLLSSGNSNIGGAVSLGGNSSIVLTAFGASGIFGAANIVLNSNENIVVGGNINTSNSGGSGAPVVLNAGGTIYAGNITTSGIGANVAGNIQLAAGSTVTVGNLTAGGGGANIGANGSYVTTGNVTNASGLVKLTASTGTIVTDNISSPLTISTGALPLNSVSLNAGLDIITGNITAGSSSGNGGGVSLTGNNITTGTILTPAGGGNSGSIYIKSSGAVVTANINAASPAGFGGLVTIAASGLVQTGFIDTSSLSALSGGAGLVVVTAGKSVNIGNITSITTSEAGDGGSVLVKGGENGAAGAVVTIGSIDTDASSSLGSGGSVYVSSTGSIVVGNINTDGSVTTDGTSGGNVTLNAVKGITVNNITATSATTGGNVLIVGGADSSHPVIAIRSIDTSVENQDATGITGGSVEIVNYFNSITVTAGIDTSATSNSGSVQAGSVGLSAGAQAVGLGQVVVGGINASTSTIGSASIGGDIYAAGADSVLGDVIVNLGNVNTAGANVATSGIVYAGAGAIGGTSSNFNIAPQVSTPAPIEFFATSGASHSLEGSTTLTFNGTAIPTANANQWQPGAYSNFGDTSPLALTLAFTSGGFGDSRLLLPIVVTGGSSGLNILSSISGNNNNPGAQLFQQNGYNVNIVSAASLGIQLGGNITVNNHGNADGTVTLLSTGGNIWQTGTGLSISGIGLTVATNGGSIGVSSSSVITPLNAASTIVGANATGGGSAYINTTATIFGFSDINSASNVFQVTALTPSILSSANLIEGASVSLISQVNGGSISVDGLVYATNQLTLQAPGAVELSPVGTALSAGILIETPSVNGSGLIHATTGTLAVDNSFLTHFSSNNLTFNTTTGWLAETAMSLSAQGNIDFGGLITNGVFPAVQGENVVIVAGGNILATAPAANMDAGIILGSSLGNGGSLTMIAGAQYTMPTKSFNDIVITGANISSTTGGSIILDGSTVGGNPTFAFTSIDTSSSVRGGGSVTLFANGTATTPNQGVILLPDSKTNLGSVTTGGVTSNGNITAYFAWATTDTSPGISAGALNIAGTNIQAAGSGVIDLECFPVAIVGTSVQFTNGLPSGGSFSHTENTGLGSIIVGIAGTSNITTQKGTLILVGGGPIQPNFTDSSLNAHVLKINSLADVVFTLPIAAIDAAPDSFGNGGLIDIEAVQSTYAAGASLTANGINNGSGGEVLLASNAGFTLPGNLSVSANGAGTGNGGTVELFTNLPLAIGSGSGSILPSATGPNGFIELDGGSLTGGVGQVTRLELRAENGSVGTNISPFTTNTTNLSAFSVLSVFVMNSGTAPLTVQGSGAGDSFLVTSGGSISTAGGQHGSITAPQGISLTSSLNTGVLTIAAGDILSSNSIDLVQFGSSSAINIAGTLTATQGVGGNGGTIQIQGFGTVSVVGNLNADATGTGSGGLLNILADGTQPFTIGSASANGISGSLSAAGASSTTNGTIAVRAGGSISTFVAIPNVNILSLQSDGGSIIIGPQLGEAGTSFVTLTAAAGVTYSSTRNLIIANNVTLEATGAGGTLGTATSSLLLNAANVGIRNAGGLVTITDVSNGETVSNGGVAGIVGGTLGFLGTGLITFSSGLTAAGTFSIVDSNTLGVSNGNIVVNGPLSTTGAGSTLNLITNGSGSISGSGSAQASTVNLTTGSGNIGTNLATPFAVAAANVVPTSTGLVSITDNQTMTLSGSGISAASSVFLGTTNNGSILVHGQVGNDATGAVTLNANGTGSITANQDIHGGLLSLISGTGNIGTLNAGALPVVSTNFSSNTSGAGFSNIIDTQTFTAVSVGVSSAGSSYTLSFAGPGPLTLTNVSAAGGPIFVADSGNVVLGNLSASTNITVFTQSFLGAPVGNITVTGSLQAGTAPANAGFINLDALKNASSTNLISTISTIAGAQLVAENGKITLEQDNTTQGQIQIGADTVIDTLGASGGAVNIVFGPVPTSPIQGPTPAHVTINHPGSGTAFFGTNGITVASGGTATLTLNGSNIVFNTGALPASAIVLGNLVSITADPTAPAVQAQLLVSPISLNMALAPTRDLSANAGLVGAVNSPTVLAALNNVSFASATPFLEGSHMIGANALPTSVIIASAQNAGEGNASGGNASALNTTGASSGVITNSTYGAIGSNGGLINSANASAITPVMFRTPDGSWMSDTELVSGKLPAIFASEEEMGITTDVSTVVEMEEQDDANHDNVDGKDAVTHAVSCAVDAQLNPSKQLSGSVAHTVGGAKVINLKRGSVLFAPSRNTLVNTPFGSVKIDARSVVFIISFRHGLAVFDLDDCHGKAVVVKAGSQEVTLRPGMHTSITRDSIDSFDEVNPAQLIGHRNLDNRSMGQGLKAFVSEFSVAQAVHAVTSLKQVVNSNNPHARRLVAHMLKTAAILQQVNRGNYEQVTRHGITAYQQQAALAFGQ
jgi:mucin-19